MASGVGFAALVLVLGFLALLSSPIQAQLSPAFYDKSCPQLKAIVRDVMYERLQADPRVGAKLLRVHFHDCFVQGCDGSVLLDDIGRTRNEKNANPNRNSLKGFEVVDAIKTRLEEACPGIVSCADILAVAAEVGVELAGGDGWTIYLGRRDSMTASLRLANRDIPPPTSNVRQLVAAYKKKGLSVKDMVVLSGGHTIGVSRCASFTQRLYNQSGNFQPDRTLEKSYLFKLQQACPQNGNGNVTQSLDFTPTTFDNNYYKNLMANLGLLNSDQVLTTQNRFTASLVQKFSEDQGSFFAEFGASMIKMGNISPLTGSNKGEIRKNCRVRN